MTPTITGLDDYFDKFGPILGQKAAAKLNPLFRPDKDEVDDFSDLLRQPFRPQAEVITAVNRTLDHSGSAFVVGEMGVGKTYIGQSIIHKNAKGQPYRAIVLCPDHLISTWKQEIEETIPDAKVVTFENWRGLIPLLNTGYEVDKNGRRSKRWPRPLTPEWYIIGRDQAKYAPKFIGVGEEHMAFGAEVRKGMNLRTRQTGTKDVYNDATEQFDQVPEFTTYVHCPRCGEVAKNEKGTPLDPASVTKKQTLCSGFWLEEVADPDRKKCGLDRLAGRMNPLASPTAKQVQVGGKLYNVVECKEQLWNYTTTPYRYPPAVLVQKKLRKWAKYLVIDEVHEQKSDESAQSLAAGKLMAATRKVLALTGTLIGGYAHHLFPLLMRMAPTTVREEGFEWGKNLQWSQVYGRVDRIVKTSQGGAGVATVGRNQNSMRKARTGRSEQSYAIRPGVMPTMYGRHMLGNSAFITLSELEDELPNLDEYVAEGACDMDPDQKEAYDFVERRLVEANMELLAKGSIKLLSTMLWTTLDYPDKPFGWLGDHEKMHTVGYYDAPNNKTRENWRGVVTPPSLDEEVVRPKERKLIDICQEERSQGKQVWVYCQMTGKRDVQPRLKRLLEAEGFRVAVLRSSDVDRRGRKEWIDKNAHKYDVVISNPRLVSTGLTLFDKGGSYNFPTLVFYQTGFNLFELRQASRRAWRIGQPHDCKVYYLYYKGTMQERAMMLMSRKMSAAAALDGKFSTEGLVGLADEDSAQIALARSINEKLGVDAKSGWSRSRDSGRCRKYAEMKPLLRGARLGDADLSGPGRWKPKPMTMAELDALDDLPMPAQMAAQTILDRQADAADAADVIRFEPRVHNGPAPVEQAEPAEFVPPPLSREALAAMFANLEANGLDLDDL